MRLSGKTAIVTGAGVGIGRRSAALFAQHGASVVVADVSQATGSMAAEGIRETGGIALFVQADVSNELQVERLMARAIAEFGRLDVLLNNAGIEGPLPRPSLTETTVDAWDRVLRVNLTGTFLTCKHAVPIMRRFGGGSIINVSSVAALVGASNFSPYCASKGGVISLSKALAVECGPSNIRVNCICPRAIYTDMGERVIRNNPEAPHLTEDEVRATLLRTQVLPKVGMPDDIAHAALYLASDESSYMTGSLLVIDGGYAGGLSVPR